jgi:exopolysaccharide biosynthesis polyprenyl glycosylphosphotransferase
MKNNATLVYNFFLIIGDFLALVVAFVGAYILRVTVDSRPVAESIPARTYFYVFLTLLPFWIIIFALLGLYNSSIYEKRFTEVGRLFLGSFIGLLFVVFWNFLSVEPVFPAKLVPIYGFGLSFFFLVVFRNLARATRAALFSYEIGLTNLLIVGSTSLGNELITSLMNSKHSGYRIIGVVGKEPQIPTNLRKQLKVFGRFSDAVETVGADAIHSIVQTEIYSNDERNKEILEFAQTNHASYRFAPGNSELFVGNIDVELFRSAIPVITVHQTALFGWGRIVKRLFDLLVGSIILLLVSPILLLVALLIKIDDRGPVFFRQTRLTRFNREFRVFKFRTNRMGLSGLDPEAAFTKMGRLDLLKKFRDNGNFLVNDPRNTRIGNFLRKTSLDELPQLFNVMTGDLSLVGPRALIPKDLDAYDKRHAILSVKSGITGLAQVSGRNNLPVEERRRLDVYYAQNWSFWLDLVILIKTFKVVTTKETQDRV